MELFLVKVLGILLFSVASYNADLEEVYTWNYVEYENLPHPDDYYVTPDEPYYIPGNANVQGIGYQASTGTFIVTVSRSKKGVPSTVNAFCAEDYKKGSNTPKVWCFPNCEVNELKADYFETAKRRAIRSAEDKTEEEFKKDAEKEMKVEKPEFEVKNDEIEKNEKSDGVLDAKVEMTKVDDEETLKLNSDHKETDENVEENIDSGKTGIYSSKHKDKDRNKYPSQNYHTKPTHSHAESKPQYTHGGHNKPQYTHVVTSKPSKPHGTHASKPETTHVSKPEYHHSNKPHYSKPQDSHVNYQPHKNKYGSLSQIHSVHSHSTFTGHKDVHYVPIPYKDDKIAPTSPPPPKEKYALTSEKNLISVWHPVIDDVCNRVWFLDTGALNYRDGDIKIELASLWIIDLPSDAKCREGSYRVSRRFEIPESLVPVGRGLTNIALDYKKGGTCDDVFAYFPNAFTATIYVYDYKNNKAWSFHEHYSFFPVAKGATYEIDGEEFTENFGVFSITLGWRNAQGYRTAFYISPTTTVQFGVSTEVLKQEDLAPTNYNPDDFQPIGNQGYETQAVTHVFDSKNGVIFYGDRDGLSLRCWNVRKPPTPDYNIVLYTDPNFVFIHEIFIDARGYLWALSNRNPFYIKFGFDTSKVNVRLYREHVDKAIKDTLCANDEEEYRADGVFDYPKELPDFIPQS